MRQYPDSYGAEYIQSVWYLLEPVVCIFDKKRFLINNLNDNQKTPFGSITYDAVQEKTGVNFNKVIQNLKSSIYQCHNIQNQKPSDITEAKSWCKTLYNLVNTQGSPWYNYKNKDHVNNLKDLVSKNYLEADISYQIGLNQNLYIWNIIKPELDKILEIKSGSKLVNGNEDIHEYRLGFELEIISQS